MRQLIVALLSMTLSGCYLAATELQVQAEPLRQVIPLSSPSDNVYTGTGGSRTILVSATVQQPATNLWVRGTPPCAYEVLDVVQDKRGAGAMSMAALRDDMIHEASSRGGTDVVLLEHQTQLQERPPIYNVSTDGSRGPVGVVAPIRISNTRYAITRCLGEKQPPQEVSQDQWRRIPWDQE